MTQNQVALLLRTSPGPCMFGICNITWREDWDVSQVSTALEALCRCRGSVPICWYSTIVDLDLGWVSGHV